MRSLAACERAVGGSLRGRGHRLTIKQLAACAGARVCPVFGRCHIGWRFILLQVT